MELPFINLKIFSHNQPVIEFNYFGNSDRAIAPAHWDFKLGAAQRCTFLFIYMTVLSLNVNLFRCIVSLCKDCICVCI